MLSQLENTKVKKMKTGKDCVGVGCGAVIINTKNEILLVKRASTSRTEPETWSRPGGEVEFFEKIEDAVIREVKEETNIDIEIIDLLEISQVITKKNHWIAFGYLAKPVSNNLVNTEPNKHDAIKWFPLDKLPKTLNKYTKDSIEKYKLRNNL